MGPKTTTTATPLRRGAARPATERVTILGVEGRLARLVQADHAAGSLRLRHVAVREVPEHDVAAATAVVKSLVATLDRPLGRCLLVVPRSEVLVRYVTLPATTPAELRRLATYQLHGELPFSLEECELAIQPLARDERGTHALVAVVHRPVVEPLLAVARGAGLAPEAITVSTEGAALWAGHLWDRLGTTPPSRWLFASVAGTTVELGIVEQGRLLFMRSGRLNEETPEALAQLIQETVTGCQRELVAATPEAALVIGALLDPADWETRLSVRLDRPVHVVDPASTALWEEPLATATLELLHEVPLTDLLGIASEPRQVALDLLPVAWQVERLAAQVRRVWRGTAMWLGGSVGVLAVAALVVLGQQWATVRRLEEEAARLESSAKAVQRTLASVERGLAARRRTAAMMRALHEAAARMPSGVRWSTAMLDDTGQLTLRGVAPGYPVLFEAVSALAALPGARGAEIRSAREPEPGRLDYELAVTVGTP